MMTLMILMIPTLFFLHAFTAWEVVPTGLGDVNALYFTDKSSKYFTHLREILHLLDRQDLSKLYGMVVKHYEVNPLAGTGLILWGDLHVLFESTTGGFEDVESGTMAWLGVILTTSVSRPQLKSNRLEDRVMHNNSEGKKQQVKDHRMNFKKCVLNDNHDICVLQYINGVNSMTKQPIAVPISTREPKRTANQSVATSLKKTVAIESTTKKPRSIIRKLYEQLIEIILFIIDSGCSKYMTRNLKLLSNFVEKFLGTVKFGNDQIAPILGYGDLVQGNITIKRVYYVKGLNHNLFSIGQF
ncbi:hypothetical protein Tco_0943840 [Tanacetum coccineum]